VDKAGANGLERPAQHIVFGHCWTPLDIREQHYSNKGAIYGVVSDRFKNFGLQGPKQSVKYPNLFSWEARQSGRRHADGVLCGQSVARRVVAWDRSMILWIVTLALGRRAS